MRKKGQCSIKSKQNFSFHPEMSVEITSTDHLHGQRDTNSSKKSTML